MDFIVFAVIALIISLAIIKIVKEKKAGAKCVGCSHSKTCGEKQNKK